MLLVATGRLMRPLLPSSAASSSCRTQEIRAIHEQMETEYTVKIKPSRDLHEMARS